MPLSKSVILLITLLCTLLFTPLSQAISVSGGSAEDQATLKTLSDQWVADYLSGNIDGLVSVLDEDAMILSQKQPNVVGIDAIRSYFEKRAGNPGVSFKDTIEEIRINGSWAFVRGNFMLEVASKEEGKPGYKRAGRYLVLYEKNAGGEWKMLRDIDNDAPME